MFSPKLPTNFSLHLALIIELGPDETEQAHELKVVAKHNDTAADVGRIVGGFQAGSANREPGEGLYVPLVLDLRPITVEHLGAHDVHTEVDGQIGPRLTCYFVEPPSGMLPD